jgi:hypothetical protein
MLTVRVDNGDEIQEVVLGLRSEMNRINTWAMQALHNDRMDHIQSNLYIYIYGTEGNLKMYP